MKNNDKDTRVSFYINFFWNFLVINSVLTPYYLSLGFSFSDIASINGVFILVKSMTDYPTGVIADEIGARSTLILAGLIKGIGGTILLLSHSYFGVMAAFVAIGIANGFYSGADLKIYSARGGDQLIQNIMDKVFFVQMGTAASSVVGSSLVGFHGSYIVPMLLNCILAWIPMFLAVGLERQSATGGKKTPRNFHFYYNAKLILREIKESRRLRLLLSVRIISFSIAFVQSQFNQSLFVHLGLPIVAFGWIAFSKALLTGLTSRFGKSMAMKSQPLFKLALFVFPLISLCAGMIPTHLFWAAVALTFLMDLSAGLTAGVVAGKVSGLAPRENIVAFESSVTTMAAIVAAVGVKLMGISLDRLGFEVSYLLYLSTAIILTLIMANNWSQAIKVETHDL